MAFFSPWLLRYTHIPCMRAKERKRKETEKSKAKESASRSRTRMYLERSVCLLKEIQRGGYLAEETRSETEKREVYSRRMRGRKGVRSIKTCSMKKNALKRCWKAKHTTTNRQKKKERLHVRDTDKEGQWEERVCVWPKEYTQRGRGRNSQSDSTHTRTHTFYLDSPNHTHKYRDGERRNTTPEASLSNNVKAQRLIAQEPCFPSMKEYLPARNTTESIRKVVQISQIKGL